VVGGIVNLDKTTGMPCHAWDRGGLCALHSYRIRYQPLSPKRIPRRLLRLSFSFLAS
jgi:hypothetical protein